MIKELRITEKNFLFVPFDPNSQFITSRLTIVNKEDWNKRGLLQRFWHWITGLKLDVLITIRKFEPLIKAHRLMEPLSLDRFKKGLLNQAPDKIIQTVISKVFHNSVLALLNTAILYEQDADGYIMPRNPDLLIQ